MADPVKSTPSEAERYHITGPSPEEYLTPMMTEFCASTSSYFKMNDKFRTPYVAPDKLVTKEAKAILVKYTPMAPMQVLNNAVRVQFQFTVGANQVLDMGSTYFDIKGVVNKGLSYKPYGGTAYNQLVPSNFSYNFMNASAPTYQQATYVLENNWVLYNTQYFGGDKNGQLVTAAMQAFYQQHTEPPPMTSLPYNNQYRGFSTLTGLEGANTSQVDAVLLNVPGTPGYQANTAVEDVQCQGAFYPPATPNGFQEPVGANPPYRYFGIANAKASTTNIINSCQPLARINMFTPVYPDTRQTGDSTNVLSTVQMMNRIPRRVCHVGFRDNFINLMYYDTPAMQGTLTPSSSANNMVTDLTDRNTELSFQYYMASLGSRYHYYEATNSCIDSYDENVRILTNDGIEWAPEAAVMGAGMLNCSQLQSFSAINFESLTPAQVPNSMGAWSSAGALLPVPAENPSPYGAYGIGNPVSGAINIAAWQKRNFLYANVMEYMPAEYQAQINNQIPVSNTAASWQNLVPMSNIIDVWSHLGSRWTPEIMEHINPFNHHRNYGLKRRSMLLGNCQITKFHIQVPQKFFAIKGTLLTPGTYTYQWYLRTDPNMVLQSSMGWDLRSDLASITYTDVAMYASFLPFQNVYASSLDVLLRQSQNAQTFADYLGAKQALYPIPANSTSISINNPSIPWQCFRGWTFGRLKATEVPAIGSSYDPTLTYSGTYPHLDGTHYLNHTLRSCSIQFNSSLDWPGNNRLLVPNFIQFKIGADEDEHEYRTAYSNMTKDFWFIQNAANYGQGYQGYHLDHNKIHHPYDFIKNYKPMTVHSNANAVVPEPGNVLNNYGAIGDALNVNPDGIPWPANFPYSLINGNYPPVVAKTTKYLIDQYMPKIPFSGSFLNIGLLTDMGQTYYFAGEDQAMNMVVAVDPMPVDTFLQVLYGVFDICKIGQPVRDKLNIEYFRIPFITGTMY